LTPLLFAVLLQSLACRTIAAEELKAALLAPEQVSEKQLAELKAQSYTAVCISLSESNASAEVSAATQVGRSALALYYWIEIGRNPTLADAHPEWMASIQTHQEYRRFFPELPKLETNQVIKNHPWVPVLYQETFPVHLERVRRLLEGKPPPVGIFLNDLQGAPSACGCGNHMCRWTTDYGPLKTATRLPNDAAAKFVGEVQKLAPKAKIIPVWTSECEEVDAKTLCAGVNCFKGTCWREFTAQLRPLADASETIAALLPYKAFHRDLPEYGAAAGWISHALNSFSTMPLRYETNGVPPNRLIAVLQGWDVTPQEITAQLDEAQKSRAAGVLVSFMPIEQGWKPRVFKLPVASR
jgi:hypothetical protein